MRNAPFLARALWTGVLLALLAATLWIGGCGRKEAEGPKPGEIVTMEGKPAPAEAYQVMQNSAPRTPLGTKGVSGRRGPPAD